jgi:hypothetical protein
MSLRPIAAARFENDPEAMRIVESVGDSVVGVEEEQRLQREAMERQLRSQSSALDPKALHGKHSVPGAAPTAVSEEKRVRGESLTEEQLLSYRGKPLLDADGDEIGPISCVYLDEATGTPKWLGAQVGSLMGSPRVVTPVFGSYIFREAISVPYSRKVILEAEVATAGAITPEQDSGLYLHFGIPLSTERSLSGLPAGFNPTRVKRSARWLHTSLPSVKLRHVGGRAVGLLTTRSAAATGASIAATRRIGRRLWPWARAA